MPKVQYKFLDFGQKNGGFIRKTETNVLILIVRRKKNAESFCRPIIGINVEYSKVLANLVMSLSGFESAKSVVGLGESSVFYYRCGLTLNTQVLPMKRRI